MYTSGFPRFSLYISILRLILQITRRSGVAARAGERGMSRERGFGTAQLRHGTVPRTNPGSRWGMGGGAELENFRLADRNFKMFEL